jgi:hypothetical protein
MTVSLLLLLLPLPLLLPQITKPKVMMCLLRLRRPSRSASSPR